MKLDRYRPQFDRQMSVYTTNAERSSVLSIWRTHSILVRKTSGGNSRLSQVIHPRFKSHLFFKQLLLRAIQGDATVVRNNQCVAEDHVTGERKVCIRVRDQHHVLLHHILDIFKNVWVFV